MMMNERFEKELKGLRETFGVDLADRLDGILMSILSDAQEEMSRGDLEEANLRINFSKYLIMNV